MPRLDYEIVVEKVCMVLTFESAGWQLRTTSPAATTKAESLIRAQTAFGGNDWSNISSSSGPSAHNTTTRLFSPLSAEATLVLKAAFACLTSLWLLAEPSEILFV